MDLTKANDIQKLWQVIKRLLDNSINKHQIPQKNIQFWQKIFFFENLNLTKIFLLVNKSYKIIFDHFAKLKTTGTEEKRLKYKSIFL